MRYLFSLFLFLGIFLMESCSTTSDVISNSRLQKRKYNSGWYTEKSNEISSNKKNKHEVTSLPDSISTNNESIPITVDQGLPLEKIHAVGTARLKNEIQWTNSKSSGEDSTNSEELSNSEWIKNSCENDEDPENTPAVRDDESYTVEISEEKGVNYNTGIDYVLKQNADDRIANGEKKRKLKKPKVTRTIWVGFFLSSLSTWGWGWDKPSNNLPVLGIISGGLGVVICIIGLASLKKVKRKKASILYGIFGILYGLFSVIVCLIILG